MKLQYLHYYCMRYADIILECSARTELATVYEIIVEKVDKVGFPSHHSAPCFPDLVSLTLFCIRPPAA
jgi:hypothetical protein